MAKLEWPEAVDFLRPYVVKLSTPRGSGTGFILSVGGITLVATAAHVVDNAHYWEEPIRVQHSASGQSVLLHATERAIFLKESFDTAALIFAPGPLPFPQAPLSLTPEDTFLKIGYEIGWLGYPAISPANLCFFSGRISSYNTPQNFYFVDGVAINGVSGGPAFHLSSTGHAVVIGVMSAYIPNRATGEVLPGLCVVRDVTQFQELAKEFATLREAKEKESEPTQPPPPPEKSQDGAV